jgi:AraC-like DNA-binding protein
MKAGLKLQHRFILVSRLIFLYWGFKVVLPHHFFVLLAKESRPASRIILFVNKSFNMTLAYLQKLRLQNARQMLESTTDTFNEITWKVGYNDVSSFQRLFKHETGLSPRDYRARFALI